MPVVITKVSWFQMHESFTYLREESGKEAIKTRCKDALGTCTRMCKCSSSAPSGNFVDNSFAFPISSTRFSLLSDNLRLLSAIARFSSAGIDTLYLEDELVGGGVT